MPDVLIPMSGVHADKFLADQKYDINTISQNMFSAATKKGMKPMVQPTVLKGVNIQKLWDSVYANGSDFLARYHDRRKEVNLKVGDWSYAADKGSGYRFVTLTTHVDVPRAGTPTTLNEAHRFVYFLTEENKPTIVYQISSQTPNVPAGGSFRTEAYCEITADSADADCSIGFWGNCRKMTMAFSIVSSIATPRAIREMTAAYKLMVDMILEDLCGGAGVSGGVSDAGDFSENAVVSDANGGGAGEEAGGGDIDGGAPSSVFQGVLLVLALIVSLALLRSMMVVNRTAGQVAIVAQAAQRMEGGAAPIRGPGGGVNNGIPLQPLTEEQALMNAARDAQMQTLRYRWLEQREALTDIQGSLSSMRWMVYVQWVLIIGISVKIFFF